jgi:hypothetical protein
MHFTNYSAVAMSFGHSFDYYSQSPFLASCLADSLLTALYFCKGLCLPAGMAITKKSIDLHLLLKDLIITIIVIVLTITVIIKCLIASCCYFTKQFD